MLELAVYSILNDRPLFDQPLDEPAFYRRYFYRWVKEGIEEVRNMTTRSDVKNRNPGGWSNEAFHKRAEAMPPASAL